MNEVAGPEEVYKALGYATAYAATGEYDTLDIYQDGGADFVCIYRRGEHSFTMGAVWRPELKTYTFHS